MLNYSDIDRTFRALAEPTRRAIVERLTRAPASVGDVAKPFDMSLAAVVQHIQVLEECGLITTEKVGRTRICQLNPQGFEQIATWVSERKSHVERKLDRLGDFLKQEGESK